VADAGTLLWKSPIVPAAERPQAEVKARLIAEAVALGGVDAMLAGAGDLAFGLPFVQELASRHALPYVAANLVCDGKEPFPGSRRVERGGRAFLFVGVVGDTIEAPGCTASDTAAAVAEELANARDGDVVVVLSGQRGSADEALAKSAPRVDFVVNGQEREQSFTPEPLPGGALRLAVGSRGKHLGRLDVTWATTAQQGAPRWRDAGAGAAAAEKRGRLDRRLGELREKRAEAADPNTQERLDRQLAFYEKERAAVEEAAAASARTGGNEVQNTLMELSASVADHPATAALVAKAKTAIAAAEPGATGAAIGFAAMGPFAGSGACAGCHVKQTVQWQSTPHAHAYASLKTTGRAMDRECYACHVTGAHHPDGPKSPAAVQGLEDVGCEACHGAGRAHAADPSVPLARAKPDASVCASCHDGVRDGGRFDAATYLPKVAHGAGEP
jgi:2',3'-cyclic-nucleotide 2'-phosphodiesterase (5'-nucleotidase family)